MKGLTTMTPNLDRAATAAAETLIKYQITTAPVIPLPILKSISGVVVLSFTEWADRMGLDRQNVINTFDASNRDVITSVQRVNDKLRYVVAYNQRLPFYMLQRSLARELGHIVLGHDGSLPEDVRQQEALCFARHLLCPRPLIVDMQNADIPITIETLGNVTGCYERCLAGIRKTPATHVPPTLNRLVREQFADYVNNFLDCRELMANDDETGLVDFGTYLDGYVE